jgi:hypothetical protein
LLSLKPAQKRPADGDQFAHGAAFLRLVSAAAAMLPGVAIANKAADPSTMHPAAAIAHRRCPARTAVPGLSSAFRSGLEVFNISNHFNRLLRVHGADRSFRELFFFF